MMMMMMIMRMMIVMMRRIIMMMITWSTICRPSWAQLLADLNKDDLLGQRGGFV